MGIGTTVTTAIEDDAGLGALMGDRIYPLTFPASPTFPCITYRIISGFQVQESSKEQIFVTRIQFDVWSETYLETAAVKEALIDLFNMADMTKASQHIISSVTDLVFDVYESNTKLHRSVVDIMFRSVGP